MPWWFAADARALWPFLCERDGVCPLPLSQGCSCDIALFLTPQLAPKSQHGSIGLVPGTASLGCDCPAGAELLLSLPQWQEPHVCNCPCRSGVMTPDHVVAAVLFIPGLMLRAALLMGSPPVSPALGSLCCKVLYNQPGRCCNELLCRSTKRSSPCPGGEAALITSASECARGEVLLIKPEPSLFCRSILSKLIEFEGTV